MAVQAIASVLAQEVCEQPEVLLVDDGSTDGTAATVAARFPEAKIIPGPGLGPGPARNAGAAAASGDILMFLESDDLWFPHHIASLLEVIRRGFPVAYGIARTIDEINAGEFMVPSDPEHGEGDCFRQLLRWCFLAPSASAVSRPAFAAVNGFDDEPFGEDWLFFLKLAALFPFGFATGEPIALCRLHRESLSSFACVDKIIGLIRGLVAMPTNEPRANFADIAHFLRMEEFIKARGAAWSGKREWYLAMKEEEMI